MDTQPALAVAVLWASLHIPGAQNLKQKRGVIKSVLEQARNRFGAACCEAGAQTLWQRAELGFTLCSGSESHARGTMERLIEWLRGDPRYEVAELLFETKGLTSIDPW